MSSPTFKVGDRVRITKDVVLINNLTGKVGRIVVDVEPGEIVVTPMSPQARMVWHAMRAGAKRVGRKHITTRDGTCWRIHKYESDHIVIRVDIALPPLPAVYGDYRTEVQR